jgi:hypothetical protein
MLSIFIFKSRIWECSCARIVSVKVDELNIHQSIEIYHSTSDEGNKKAMNKGMEVTQSVETFFCYAHEDKELRDELDNHLAALKLTGLSHSWHDGVIVPGESWEEVIQEHLNRAKIILLLVSASFLDSPFCYSTMKRALERHNKTAWVIPILLRPVDLEGMPIKKLQMLPENANPITAWSNKDEAFKSVAVGIRSVIERMVATQPLSSDVASPERRDAVLPGPLPPLSPWHLRSPAWRWLFKQGGAYQIIIVLLILLLLVLKVEPVVTSSEKKMLVTGPTTTALVSTPVLTPRSGTVLYTAADWSKWNIANEWSLSAGKLENNGRRNTSDDGISFLLAPFSPSIGRYAVDASIEAPNGVNDFDAFGIVVGSDGNIDGYACYFYQPSASQGIAGITPDPSNISLSDHVPLKSQVSYIDTTIPNLDTTWHEYRVEVHGNQIALKIDGIIIVQRSFTGISGKKIGVIDSGTAINVKNFKVTAL